MIDAIVDWVAAHWVGLVILYALAIFYALCDIAANVRATVNNTKAIGEALHAIERSLPDDADATLRSILSALDDIRPSPK